MPEGVSSAQKSQPNPARNLAARRDIAVIAGLTALMAVIVLLLQAEGGFSAAEIIPYALLWGALCLSGYFYRRWSALRALAGVHSMEGGSHNPVGHGSDDSGREYSDGFQYQAVGTWEWNLVDNSHVWSDEVFKIYSLNKSDFHPTYENYLKLVHPEDRLNVEETVSRSLREKTGYALDYRFITPEGEVRIVHEQGKVQSQKGKPVSLTGTISDVTDRKREETDLRYRFGILQNLIDGIPVPVFHKDANGNYKSCNKAFEKFYGKPKEEIIGKSVFDLDPSDLAIIYDNADKALFRQGGSQTYEAKVISGKGHLHDSIIHKAVLTNKDGSVGGLIGTILDISDRKQMEVALKDSEQRFRNIAQSASDWFWETDEEHRFSFLSDKVTDIMGITKEAVLGKTRVEIAGKDQIDENRELWEKHLEDLKNRRPFRDMVYVFADKDGHDHFVRINGVPVFDDDGNFRGYRGTGTDITDHKRVEDALRESEERHRHFAADVAHELRTPLAVLRTHLDNLSDSKEVQSLRQDVDNMSRMVAQLLAVTRIETFTLEDSLNDVDLREVCRNVATLLAPIAIKEHRSIEVTGGKDQVFVRGNSGTLEQAVRNLVENAIRYSARGTIISLNVEDGEVPKLKVIDRGRGIAMEQREKIFQRFKRADRRGGGAGLGLSIVKRAVESHNAEIEIEDTPGGGATFIIRFPSKNIDTKP